jgi:hypothetical protein
MMLHVILSGGWMQLVAEEKQLVALSQQKVDSEHTAYERETPTLGGTRLKVVRCESRHPTQEYQIHKRASRL